jgi:uncharacterized surface protein with fasciclin (FAS1) repeats
MKKMTSFKILPFCIVFVFAFTGCGSPKPLSDGSSLMTAISGSPNLSTITALLKTPGLSNLMGSAFKEPYTLLAPTNEAFNALSPTTLSDLKNPANVQQVANLLKNNIVPSKVDPSQLGKGGISNVEGNPLNLAGANLGSAISAGKKANIIPIDKVIQ